MTGTLYLVATPIGNLGDFPPRAVETLRLVDFIAAEDTRVTLKLLNHFEIKKPLVSYYEHNRAESGEKIIARLLGGESCALVSDAGMPAISDPGEDLVRLARENGIVSVIIPGPCAAVSALALSGLSTKRFTFEGFLSAVKKERSDHLNSLKGEERTMIFYEAPHKLTATLKDLLDTFGDRKLSVSREITKLHEETFLTTLKGAISHFEESPPRGEFVLILEGSEEGEKEAVTLEDALSHVLSLRDSGLSLKDAAKQVSSMTGLSKKVLYDAAIKK